jgi:2-hydroxy-4-carboxymuconate semialdehyde hemiacetal dehydrogenase
LVSSNDTPNVCLVGHGMMGVWHARALDRASCVRHTVVGRREQPTREFAAAYGFSRWTTSLAEALADDAIDLVIVANPSEQHAETARRVLEHGKHALVEIPLAMTLAETEQLVGLAATSGLTLGVVHPLRARPELIALRARVDRGEERIRQIAGRFYIRRLQNVGATGYQRSWTDNILWHHMAHLVDAGLWLCGSPVREANGHMSEIDGDTGTPTDVAVLGLTEHGQTIVFSGSYYGAERLFELLVVSDRDTYRLDVFASAMTTGRGASAIAAEEDNCWIVTRDFIEAIRARRDPLVPGVAIVPAMRVLAAVQDRWDCEHGEQSLPGRPLTPVRG